jgi:hypothetical protein
MAGGMAQVVWGPEFNPQYQKKKEILVDYFIYFIYVNRAVGIIIPKYYLCFFDFLGDLYDCPNLFSSIFCFQS